MALIQNKHEESCSNYRLYVDTACLEIYNNLKENISVFGQYDECERCKFVNFASISPANYSLLMLSARYPLTLNYTNSRGFICRIHQQFYEHYHYGWNLTENCNNLIYINETAPNTYLPLLWAFLIFLSFGALWYLRKWIYKCLQTSKMVKSDISKSGVDSPTADVSSVTLPPIIDQHPRREKSIDAFRGFCILFMIFLHYGGSSYWFVDGVVWNGLAGGNLVMPWFIWIMGFSFTISLNKKLQKAIPRRRIFLEIVRRSLMLIFLGLFVNSLTQCSPSKLILPGVLQRLGLCYFFVGIIETTFAKENLSINEFTSFNFVQDLMVATPQWIIMVIIILVHTLITFLLYVPGCGRGYLGPGGLHELGQYYNCTAGAAGYIDRKVFGDYMGSKLDGMYEVKTAFDASGILGTLPSVVLMYFGVHAGRILYTYNSVKLRVLHWTAWGCAITLIGGILCGFSKNDGVIPINWYLTSLSLVFVLGGAAFIIEACLFITIDILRKWDGEPFSYPGTNAIALYMVHHIIMKMLVLIKTPSLPKTHAVILCKNLSITCVWAFMAMLLYKKKSFYSI